MKPLVDLGTRHSFAKIIIIKTKKNSNLHVRPSQNLNLVPLRRMFQAHVIAHAVRMCECLCAKGYGTNGRVLWIVHVQVRPHLANVHQGGDAQRASIATRRPHLAQPRRLALLRLMVLPRLMMLHVILHLLVAVVVVARSSRIILVDVTTVMICNHHHNQTRSLITCDHHQHLNIKLGGVDQVCVCVCVCVTKVLLTI